jgi:hypothetical protein
MLYKSYVVCKKVSAKCLLGIRRELQTIPPGFQEILQSGYFLPMVPYRYGFIYPVTDQKKVF